ncbi:HeH/LEM domain-containing protein [Pediococcus acidilactici]
MLAPLKGGVSKVTNKNTIAEIKAWLDEHHVEHNGISKKDELLALVNEVM